MWRLVDAGGGGAQGGGANGTLRTRVSPAGRGTLYRGGVRPRPWDWVCGSRVAECELTVAQRAPGHVVPVARLVRTTVIWNLPLLTVILQDTGMPGCHAALGIPEHSISICVRESYTCVSR